MRVPNLVRASCGTLNKKVKADKRNLESIHKYIHVDEGSYSKRKRRKSIRYVPRPTATELPLLKMNRKEIIVRLKGGQFESIISCLGTISYNESSGSRYRRLID